MEWERVLKETLGTMDVIDGWMDGLCYVVYADRDAMRGDVWRLLSSRREIPGEKWKRK